MTESGSPLDELRRGIDGIDGRLLDLLEERGVLTARVLRTKQREGLPIFVPAREEEKVAAFRAEAEERGLDPEWAEDFLRMIMGSSRARQAVGSQPCSTPEPRTVLLANRARRAELLRFLDHHGELAELVRQGDREAFVQRFREVQEFFGDFAGQALRESSYLIHRLADRFAE